MSNDRCNKSIHCTVEQWQTIVRPLHCALDSITVGTHEANPTMDQQRLCPPAKVLLISSQCEKGAGFVRLFSSVLI